MSFPLLKDLEQIIEQLNHLTKQPSTPWTRDDKAKRMTANIGNYHLSRAYGGHQLHQMHTEGGGVTVPIYTGYTTKRELYNAISYFIAGIKQ